MNLIAEAPALLVALLALLLVAGAVQDSVQLRISNLIPLAILLLAAAAAVAAGPTLGLWQNLALVAVLLGLGSMLFATGKFGGGDVKLLAVTALWVDLGGALNLLSMVFIAGGVLALIVLGSRMVAPERLRDQIAVLRSGSGIPYGVAIAIGALGMIGFERLG